MSHLANSTCVVSNSQPAMHCNNSKK